MITLENFVGMHISAACKEAVDRANAEQDSVRFEFNGTEVIAQPGDSPEQLEKKWSVDFETAAEAYRNSPEYKEARQKEAEEYQRKISASMKEAAQTEAEMRETKEPWPYTQAQLTEYIASLVDRQHDYGTCVYALSLAAAAAFNYVSHQLGVTVIQASCADLDFIRRTRGIKGPFILIKAEDALYPQYDLPGKLAEAMEEWKPWLKEQAEKQLADKEAAHPNVVKHWKKLSK
jgi:hypothetical protein